MLGLLLGSLILFFETYCHNPSWHGIVYVALAGFELVILLDRPHKYATILGSLAFSYDREGNKESMIR